MHWHASIKLSFMLLQQMIVQICSLCIATTRRIILVWGVSRPSNIYIYSPKRWNSYDTLTLWSNCKSYFEAAFAESTALLNGQPLLYLARWMKMKRRLSFVAISCFNNQTMVESCKWWYWKLGTLRLCRDLVRLDQEMHWPTLAWWYQAYM